MVEENKNRIEIRSGEVQEILGGVPSGLVRYGIVLFAAVFALMIAFSFVFSYPDMLKADIVVTTENPPATIVARSSGKIERLFVSDKARVKKGQLIALVENPAEYEDMLVLEKLIDSIGMTLDSAEIENQLFFDKNLHLGSVQEYYSAFLSRIEELRKFNSRNFYSQKHTAYKEQVYNANLLYDRLWEQKVAIDKEYHLKDKHYQRQQKLMSSGVISDTDLEKAEAEMLAKKSALDAIRSDLAQKKIDIGELKQRIIENEKAFIDEKTRYETALQEAFSVLKSQVSSWMLSFLMRSPIDGVVTFNAFYAENQNIKQGDRAFTVVPASVGKLIGKLKLKVRGSGKVRQGLPVNVKFENYPYVEFGMVKGKVDNVSLVPEDNFYMVEINFPDGLVTNYGVDLQMHNQLNGRAEIITEDLKLVQRFFNPLKALWKERVQ